MSLIPRGWLVVGLAGLIPAFVRSAHAPELIAVALGGIILVYRALGKLVMGLTQITDALIAWRGLRKLFVAAGRSENPTHPLAVTESRQHQKGDELIKAKGLTFCFPGRRQATLNAVDLSIKAGDRILFEGASGCGKSTLGALITGLRNPTEGLVLFKGMDRITLGTSAWRRHIAGAPQFHENRVFTGTFLFNLLIGRRWPPEAQDIRDATQICQELGLGEVIARTDRRMAGPESRL